MRAAKNRSRLSYSPPRGRTVKRCVRPCPPLCRQFPRTSGSSGLRWAASSPESSHTTSRPRVRLRVRSTRRSRADCTVLAEIRMARNAPASRSAARQDKATPVPRARSRRGRLPPLAGQKRSQGLRWRGSNVRIRERTYHANSSCIAWTESYAISANGKHNEYRRVSYRIRAFWSKTGIRIRGRLNYWPGPANFSDWRDLLLPERLSLLASAGICTRRGSGWSFDNSQCKSLGELDTQNLAPRRYRLPRLGSGGQAT